MRPAETELRGGTAQSAIFRGWRWLLMLAAATYLALYVVVALLRVGYPFALEWLEGGMAVQVQRIVNGLPVYVLPSVDFVPFLYGPLYFYVSALVMKMLGGVFFPLRLVSLIASLGCFAMIYAIVARETKQRWLGFVMAGLFAATFRATGAWFDLARVDSLFLLLFLAFVYCVRCEPSKRAYLLAGVFGGLAFLTKQIALIACAPVLLYCAWRNLRYTLFLMMGSAFLLIATVTAALTASSHGWFTYYIFDLLGGQFAFEWPLVIQFWWGDLCAHLLPAISAAIYYLLVALRRNRSACAAWSLLLLGALTASFTSRVKLGGYDNVLIPVFAVVVIVSGLGVHELLLALRTRDATRRAALIGVQLGLLCQFCLFYYRPSEQLPTAADQAAGWRLVSYVAQVPGPVYIPCHGYLAAMAGKQSFANHDAIWDIMRSRQSDVGKAALQRSLDEAIEQQKIAAVVLDGNWAYFPRLTQYYERQGTLFAPHETEVFNTVTGRRTRPLNVWVPKQVKASVSKRKD